MDLLSSVRKQRELFSQSLTTAVVVSTQIDAGTTSSNVTEEHSTRRMALSPRNKKSGLNNATQRVSSIRYKQEDLVKQYESSTGKTDEQENCMRRSIVNLSGSQKDKRQTEEDRARLPSKVQHSKYKTRDKPKTSSCGNAIWNKQSLESEPTLISSTVLSSPRITKSFGNSPKSESNSWIKRDFIQESSSRSQEKAIVASRIKEIISQTQKQPVSRKIMEPPWIKKADEQSIGSPGILKGKLFGSAIVRDVAGESCCITSEDIGEKGHVRSPRPLRKQPCIAVSRDFQRRKSVGSFPTWAIKGEKDDEERNPRAMLKPVTKKLDEDRRKSAPTASWIRQPSPDRVETDNVKQNVAPWLQNDGQTMDTLVVKPSSVKELSAANSKTARHPESPTIKVSTEPFSISAKSAQAKPKLASPTHSKLSSPCNGKISSRAKLFEEADALPPFFSRVLQETSTGFRDKVDRFKEASNPPPVTSYEPPRNEGIKSARLKWEAAQRSQHINGITRNAKQLYFERSSNFSSLRKSAEKISLGLDPDSPESHDPLKEEPEKNNGTEECSVNDSVEPFVVFEYGDANFSFNDIYPNEEEGGLFQDEFGFEYDKASESSTFKVDNYPKDFNTAISIQSPWETPPDAFDHITSNFGDMKIISIAPSETEYESPVEHDSGIPSVESTFPEFVLEDTEHTSKNSMGARSHRRVATNPHLHASEPEKRTENKRGTAYIMFGNTEQDQVDPIFQSFGEIENKVKNKSMFKMLKKGLVSTTISSSRKNSDEVTEGAMEATEDFTEDDKCSQNGESAMSSITRSVNTHNVGSRNSSDSNNKAPLGVLNGFFKAALKLQKKKKKKKSRGRSINKPLPTVQKAQGEMIVDFGPQDFPAPEVVDTTAADDAQLWHDLQQQEFEPKPTPLLTSKRTPSQAPIENLKKTVDGRRFGAVGGLASTRSKAIEATIEPIVTNLASW